MIRENRVKKKIKNGEFVLGTFVRANDPAVAEALGMTGLDFIVIDNEHTAMNRESMTDLIRAAELTGIVPTVRVKQKSAADILQALDAGAMGVQVPQVDTKEEAGQIVRWAKYAPEGVRGFAASQRSAGYGSMDPVEYAAMSNENTLVVCYCETRRCVENLDEILQVPGVDVVFLGPFDLSQAYGVIGQPSHPVVQQVIDTVIRKVRAGGKAVGIISSSAEETRRWIEKGVQYFAYSSDLGMLSSASRRFVSDLRG